MTAEQLRALGSTTRLKVFQAFRRGPRSVAEVAPEVGMPEKSLYYHVTALERVGLLAKLEQRHVAKKPQWLYEAPSKAIVVVADLTDPEMAAAAEKNVLALLRSVGIEYKKSVEHFGNGSNDLGMIQRRSLVLDQEGINIFRKRVLKLIDEMPQSETGYRLHFTAVLNPIEEV